MHHFGRGIVTTPADFGRLGTQPSHPQLLDWLAAELRESGWSLKSLHRAIVLSTVYRQSSRREPAPVASDAENRYYTRQNVMRLDAEALRDRALTATATLDRTLHGPPTAITEDDAGQVIVVGDVQRRSLYLMQRRSQPVSLMQAFDAPVMQTNCELRPSSTVATQSLMLMNGQFWLNQAVALAKRVTSSPMQPMPSGLSIENVSAPHAARAWQLAYCRLPTRDELQLACEFLARQREFLQTHPQHVPENGSPDTQALANLCQALLSSNEFLYVD
jgi:hypothetical protein